MKQLWFKEMNVS